jgi:hypothetical protein
MAFSKIAPLLSILALTWTAPLRSQAADTQTAGVVAQVFGGVTLDKKTAKAGDSLHVGSVIETSGGRATLLIGGESVVHVADDSRLEITQHLVDTGGHENSFLDLKYGATRALVRSGTERKKTFHIRARAATMGVRGTQIYIESPKDPAAPQQFMTIEGLADVSVGAAASNQAQAPKIVALKSHQSLVLGDRLSGKDGPRVETLGNDKIRELSDSVAPQPEEANTQNDFERKKHHHHHPKLDSGDKGDAPPGADNGAAPPPPPPPPPPLGVAPMVKIDPVISNISKGTLKIGVRKQ